MRGCGRGQVQAQGASCQREHEPWSAGHQRRRPPHAQSAFRPNAPEDRRSAYRRKSAVSGTWPRDSSHLCSRSRTTSVALRRRDSVPLGRDSSGSPIGVPPRSGARSCPHRKRVGNLDQYAPHAPESHSRQDRHASADRSGLVDSGLARSGGAATANESSRMMWR